MLPNLVPEDPAPPAPNSAVQAQRDGTPWPGTTIHEALALPQEWGDAPIPQPDSGDILGPLSPAARGRLRRQLDAREDRRHLPDQPYTASMWSFLDALATEGGTTPATRPWMPDASDPEAPNLHDFWANRPLGGCTNVEPHASRWKASFGAVTNMFNRTRAQLNVPTAFELQQEEVDPAPKPIHLRSDDDVAEYLCHLEAVTHHNEIEILSAGQHGRHEIIMPEFFVRQHGKSRVCIRGDLTKEPTKARMTKRHWQTGSRMVNHLASTDDLVMGTDQPRGCHQSEVSHKTSMRQLVLVDYELLLEALRVTGRPAPANPRLQWHGDTMCALTRPRVLQFGDPLSAELFVRKNRHVQSENRSTLGLRIAEQMDDRSLHGRLGPASLLCDFTLMLLTDVHYGMVDHLRDKITSWPTVGHVFDGAYTVPRLNLRFVPLEKDLRHRTALHEFIRRLSSSTPQATLRELTSATMTQASSMSASYPVRLRMGLLKAYLSRETKRINASVKTGKDPYAQRVAAPPKSVLRDLRALTAPKIMGEFMSTNFPVIAELWVDTSGWGYGARLTIFDATTGATMTRHRFSSFLQRHEQEHWHTHQELFGVCNALLAVLRHYRGIRGTESRPCLIRVGSDNTAALAQTVRVTANENMSGPVAIALEAARARYILLIPLCVAKLRMDLSGCDFWGRLRSHNQQWQLHPPTLHKCLEYYKIRIDAVNGTSIDLAACRATRQFRKHVSRWPEPESHATDLLTFPLRQPGSNQPLLCCYPPETMIPALVARVRDQECELFMVVPLTATARAHFADLKEMMTSYVIIPQHPDNHYPPEGYEVEGEQTSGAAQPPPWSLIFAHLSLPTWRQMDIKMRRPVRPTHSPPIMMGTVPPPSPGPGQDSPHGGMMSALDARKLAARLLGTQP